MPHYKDGTPVQVGDIARCTLEKSYNHPYPVQGVVAGFNPGSTSCNLQLVVTKVTGQVNPATMPTTGPAHFGHGQTAQLAKYDGDILIGIGTTVEYGACHEYELVYRPTKHPNGVVA